MAVSEEARREIEGDPAAAVAATWPSAALAFVEMLHPPPIARVLLAATGFTAAAARGWPAPDRLVAFLLAALLTQLAISIHNDCCDIELDRRTKPWRALPRGLVTPGAARAWWMGLVVAGLLVAATLGFWPAALVALGTSAGLAYNAWFKRGPLTWLPFWIGLPALPLCAFAVVGRFDPSLGLVYLIGAPLALGIYLADTMSDIEVDSSAGVRGLAHRLGPWRARLTCWASVGAAQGLAVAFWPRGHQPGLLFGLSVALLGGAIALDRLRRGHGHWLAIMGSAVALAVGWMIDVAR